MTKVKDKAYSTPSSSSSRMLVFRRLALLSAFLTFVLIIWGSHVNTTKSGMAFPDWPTSNNQAMLTYAPSEWLWQTDRFWEHGHRLLASLAGMITTAVLLLSYRLVDQRDREGIFSRLLVVGVFVTVATALVGLHGMPGGFLEVLMILLFISSLTYVIRAFRVNKQARIHRLAHAAFMVVCLQACFGGYTVLNNLPVWTSTTHGMLAQGYLMIVIGILLLSWPRWLRSSKQMEGQTRRIPTIVMITWLMTLVQFFLGALTRHTGSWGASITFPMWTSAAWLPDVNTWATTHVLTHFVHRTFAYIVAAAVVVQFVRLRSLAASTFITSMAFASMLIVVLQILLGAWILWSARGELATTLHVTFGVLLLAVHSILYFSASQYNTVQAATLSNSGGGS